LKTERRAACANNAKHGRQPARIIGKRPVDAAPARFLPQMGQFTRKPPRNGGPTSDIAKIIRY
jgi:hypothetical protein